MNLFTVIKAPEHNFRWPFVEIYRYRELLWAMAYRDYRVKYAHTGLGMLWALIQPLMMMGLLGLAFGVVTSVDTGGIPGPLFTAVGLCGWSYCAVIIAESGHSIIGAQQMIKKVYFPRLIIPAAKAITALIDLLTMLGVLVLLMGVYGYMPGWRILWLPVFIVLTVFLGLTLGIWMSALMVRYRDFKFVMPVILQVGMYATPIAYPVSAVPEAVRWIFYLNPMSGIAEGMRWSLLGQGELSWICLSSLPVVGLLFWGGLRYFRRVEEVMADLL
jgi:lipopolysaccharide transport system permease protein